MEKEQLLLGILIYLLIYFLAHFLPESKHFFCTFECFILQVIICHCRMHETYKHCCFRTTPLLPCSISRFDSVMKKNGYALKSFPTF